MSKTKILFIGNEAKRTGAPIMMLHFLRWLKENTDIEGTILLRRGGELEPDYQAIYPTYVWKRALPEGVKSFGDFAKALVDVVRNWVVQNWVKTKFKNSETIYANTFASVDLIKELDFNAPAILHVHELEAVLEGFLSQKKYQNFKKHINLYVCASEATRKHLCKRIEISVQQTALCYEFITVPQPDIEQSKAIKRQLNIPENAFIVGGSGALGWRKGSDLFVQLAVQVILKQPNSYFIWVGGGNADELQKLNDDCRKAGIADKIVFTGVKANPADYYALFDVFVLTSREDPFPLVCLENAALGKPIICFEKAGGMPEFVAEDCGYIVPYLNVATMTQAVLELIEAPEKIKQIGNIAQQKIINNHTSDKTAPQLYKILNDLTK